MLRHFLLGGAAAVFPAAALEVFSRLLGEEDRRDTGGNPILELSEIVGHDYPLIFFLGGFAALVTRNVDH